MAAAFGRAGQTLLSQPITGPRPSGYRSNMLEIVREVTEAYGYSEETVHSPAAVSEMDPVRGWVSLVPQENSPSGAWFSAGPL